MAVSSYYKNIAAFYYWMRCIHSKWCCIMENSWHWHSFMCLPYAYAWNEPMLYVHTTYAYARCGSWLVVRGSGEASPEKRTEPWLKSISLLPLSLFLHISTLHFAFCFRIDIYIYVYRNMLYITDWQSLLLLYDYKEK